MDVKTGEILHTMSFERNTCFRVTVVRLMVTVRRQVGEALVLAPLPLAVADIEVNLHGVGYSLVPVRWDLHNDTILA